ncbi:hypothetical protein [Prescottella subtropica]|uniref:hypothetical protein n=1 Tax=Prescottella subtropica TaxID=2545757 RepID=UPI001478FE4A|nr:hypothetical protein [Prescottella subtropica]
MQPGDHVRIRPGGVSVFTVVSIDDEDGTALVEAVGDAPGAYPWSAKLTDFVPAD